MMNSAELLLLLSVRNDFWINIDSHIIFIKDRLLCAAFVRCFMNYCHLFIFMRVTDTQNWLGPAPHKSSRGQPVTNCSCCNCPPVISLIFLLSAVLYSSVKTDSQSRRENVLPTHMTVCRYAHTARGGCVRQGMISGLQHPTA